MHYKNDRYARINNGRMWFMQFVLKHFLFLKQNNLCKNLINKLVCSTNGWMFCLFVRIYSLLFYLSHVVLLV